jgi:hypothetical protein
MKAYMQYKYIKDKRLAKRAGSGRDLALQSCGFLFHIPYTQMGEGRVRGILKSLIHCLCSIIFNMNKLYKNLYNFLRMDYKKRELL